MHRGQKAYVKPCLCIQCFKLIIMIYLTYGKSHRSGLSVVPSFRVWSHDSRRPAGSLCTLWYPFSLLNKGLILDACIPCPAALHVLLSEANVNLNMAKIFDPKGFGNLIYKIRFWQWYICQEEEKLVDVSKAAPASSSLGCSCNTSSALTVACEKTND